MGEKKKKKKKLLLVRRIGDKLYSGCKPKSSAVQIQEARHLNHVGTETVLSEV